jgi:drug/metabolite transporter (DMT)-like permease
MTSTPPYRPHVANVMCMFSMLIWAVALPAADMLIGKVPPLQLTAARMAMAAACLLPAWWWLEGRGALKNAGWWNGLMIGGATIGLGAFMLVVGQGMTDSVTVAVISASMPIMGIAIEVLLDGRKLTVSLLVGVLLSLAGGLLVLGDKNGTAGLGLGLGALLCFGAVLLFTIGSRMSISSFPQLTALGRTTVTLTGASLATGLGAAAGLLLGGATPEWASLGLAELGALVLFSIGGLAISQMLWIASIGSIGIAVASLHINATPFYVMITLFALGGPWNWTQAFAAAVVGLGVLIAQDIIPISRRLAANR